LNIGYPATAGYDLATGLGSVDLYALATSWITAALVSDFELKVPEQSLTVPAGSNAAANITVAPLGIFSSSVDLSCELSESLSGSTCSISPGRIAAGSTSTLTVASPQRGISTAASITFSTWMFGIVGVVALNGDRRRTSRALSIGLLLVLLLLMGLIACGGSSATASKNFSGASALTSGTVTIHGVSGGKTHSAVISVNIQ
jgi:hypothetical protein